MEASFDRALGTLGLELQCTVGTTSIHTVPGRERPTAVNCSQSTLTAAQEACTFQKGQLCGVSSKRRLESLQAHPLQKSPLWKETKSVSATPPYWQRKLDYIPPASSPHPHKALSAFPGGRMGGKSREVGVVAG